MLITSTPRLFLREFRIEDAPHLLALNNDAEVLKYMGDLPFKNLVDAQDFVRKYDHYEKYGFGRWAVILRENNAFLGWCGLKYTPEKTNTTSDSVSSKNIGTNVSQRKRQAHA